MIRFFVPKSSLKRQQPIQYGDITNNGVHKYGCSNPKGKVMEFWADIENEIEPFIPVKEPEERQRKEIFFP